MPAVVLSEDPTPYSYNSGTIEAIDGWPGWIWRTCVGPFELNLHIVSLGELPGGGCETGIASFVVMEQEQQFLNYVAGMLAMDIAARTTDCRSVILLTVEAKGSHFAPWVWKNLAELDAAKLCNRIVTLRKGPKVYMKTPGAPDPLVVIGGRQIVLSSVSYQSITSHEKQHVVISPKDADLLYEAIQAGAEPVLVDDFLGSGGTIVGVHNLFEQLNRQLAASGLIELTPPRLVAVVGSDGNLYEQALAQAQIDVTPLPQPFPLRLPTFTRQNAHAAWEIRR
jgi:hypothetical protein